MFVQLLRSSYTISIRRLYDLADCFMQGDDSKLSCHSFTALADDEIELKIVIERMQRLRQIRL